MPEYVDYGSLVVPPAPFRSLRTRLDGFIVEADGAKLDALVQRVITAPSGGAVDVLAIGNRCMLTWGAIERVSSLTPPFSGYGAVAEPQVVLWVPTAFVRRKRGGAIVAERFAMFVPFIWVDNAMSLATGRELFGYPKSWGWIGFPEAGAPRRRWSLDAFGLDFAPDSLAGRRPLLELEEHVERDGDAPWLEGIVDLARDMAHRLFEHDGSEIMVPGLRLAADLARDLHHKRFPHVFLKQVRAIEDGREAALQLIAQCWYTIERIRGRPRFHELSLTVHPVDAHPLGEELGLKTQTLNLSYEVELDFLVGGGEVLWP